MRANLKFLCRLAKGKSDFSAEALNTLVTPILARAIQAAQTGAKGIGVTTIDFQPTKVTVKVSACVEF